MDFQAVVDRLVTHATNAGRSLPNRITDVAFAHPVPAGQRCVRIYYEGESEPAHLGTPAVLNAETVSERLVIVAFWALSSDGVVATSTVEGEVREFKHQLRTNILGDSQLNGEIGDLYLDYATADFTIIKGTLYRWVELGVTCDWVEYTIAP